MRRAGPFPGDEPHPEKSGLFLYLNTNKRGVTLDLRDTADLTRFRALARGADLVIESYRPGTLDRLGIGFDALRALNPALSLVSLSNFGATGPYRDWELTDLVAFALAGPYGLWHDILSGKTLAATAILSGKLQVTGDKLKLLKHASSHRAMVHCVGTVDTVYP